jgi:sugar phosphate permease
MVLVGLGVVALMNGLFALQNSLLVMVALWGVNGVAQSTGWGPMVRILAERLSLEQRRRLSVSLPMSFSVGNALAWALAGVMVAWLGWRAAFYAPGLLLVGVLAVWWWADIDAPVVPPQARPHFDWRETRAELRQLLPVLLATGCVGFVNVGMLIWLPTYIKDTGLFPAALNGVVAGTLPLMGMAGVVLAGALLARLPEVFAAIMALLLATLVCLLFSAILALPLQGAFVVLTTVILSGLVGLLLSSVPILYAREGRASSAAGSLTAIFSIGGGLAGVTIGAVVEQFNWDTVFGLWAGCALVAMGLIRLAQRRARRNLH